LRYDVRKILSEDLTLTPTLSQRAREKIAKEKRNAKRK